MIGPAYVQTMARYNRWQNQSLYGAADTLDDVRRKEPRGAFLGSIHATLNHLLWADRIWMHRLAGWPAPGPKSIGESVDYHQDWNVLASERRASDEAILAWADSLAPAALEGDLSWYSGAAGRELTRPRWLLVTHLFNHQTHHRGQVHCLLTQLGAKPEPTDLPFMPELPRPTP
ncbi:MAG: DinB family protein [Hyphomicrobiaceae bacterium]|nr:DinB family protein [Hyphomicrobiaceae bacterium]